MVAPNVQTHGISSLYSGRSGRTAAAAERGGSFEQLLNTTKTIQVSEKKEPVKTADAPKAEGKDSKAEAEVTEKQPVTSEKEVKAEEAVSTEKPEENTAPVEKPSEEEYAERAGVLLAQVMEVIKDLLNLTDEQLETSLGELGLSKADLLNPETLKMFYLNVNEAADASALITDASLLEGFQKLTGAVEDLFKQSELPEEILQEMSASPELKKLLEEVMAGTKEPVMEPEQNETEELPGTETADVTVTEKTTENKEVTLEFKTETETEFQKSGNSSEPELTKEVPQPEQFLQNLKVAAEKIEAVSGTESIVSQIREIADQILEKVKVIVAPDTTSLEIQLTPETLGKVQLTVTEQDGVMKAKFFTENEVAKEAIESNLIQFKETLNAQGLKVESIEVTVSEFGFDKNSEAGQKEQDGSKKGKQRFVMEETDETAGADSLARHFIEGGESTVNYMA